MRQSRPRTVAIIQARMGSSRLPGKVMLNLGNRSILAYIVERISKAESLDDIIVATTTHPRDNVILEECTNRGIAYFRGSENDVLGRYYAAATVSEAEIIVRVTADNPFTDPGSIDRVVENIVTCGSDYAIEVNLPLGTTAEALTFNALALMHSVATAPRWREHVTLFAKENPYALKCAFLAPPPAYARPELSFTVDQVNDYVYVRQLWEKLPGPDFALKNLINLADQVPVRSYVS